MSNAPNNSRLERIVWVSSGFDKRHTDPKKNYGIGACRITFVLKGAEGAVQFMIGTDWYPPVVQRERRQQRHDFDTRFDKIKPDGWDVGYHSPKPMYEGQTPMERSCELVAGGVCYYDGSGLRADDWVEQFILGGTPWLWPQLETEYRVRFLDDEPPDA